MLKKLLPTRWQAYFINSYMPYIGAGIRVTNANDTLSRFEVKMSLTRWNRNIMGVHFGGSIYSMCDPFYMWILMVNLGKEYIVWDKAASVYFLKPGTGTIRATFEIAQQRINDIKAEVDTIGKNDYEFEAFIYNESGEKVARVVKVVYVRKRDFFKNNKDKQ